MKQEFGKTDAPNHTAESWELTVREDGMSVVSEGPMLGKTLQELSAADKAGYLGTDCRDDGFPVLIKLINAEKDLSVQVHPSDQTAVIEYGEQGKAEMWYVIDSAPRAAIYYGFSRRVTKEEFLTRAKNGSICEVLNRVPVKKGDVFYIMPGTIHAIGAGILIAEIQQNSNTTFRVYDYNRLGSDGKPRPVHLDRAANVINYEPLVPSECKANNTAVFPDFSINEMFSCRYFKAYKLDVQNEIQLRCDGRSFQHLLCVEGSGELIQNGKHYGFERGASIFLPAAMGEYRILGVCRMLLTRI